MNFTERLTAVIAKNGQAAKLWDMRAGDKKAHISMLPTEGNYIPSAARLARLIRKCGMVCTSHRGSVMVNTPNA